jgi:hypothetical protein
MYLLVRVHRSEASAVGVLSALLSCCLDVVLRTVGEFSGVVVTRHVVGACDVKWMESVIVEIGFELLPVNGVVYMFSLTSSDLPAVVSTSSRHYRCRYDEIASLFNS